MAEALADVLDRAARVEAMRHLDGLVEGRELLHRELLRDRLAALRRDRRHHVDDDERAHALRMRRRERDRVEPAEAHADEARRPPAERSRSALDVADEVDRR
jgi:hypothetical protein